MENERKIDFFIGKLLDLAKIKYTPNGSSINEIRTSLKSAYKKGTGRVGFPEFVEISNDFIIVIEDKADIEKQASFVNEDSEEVLILCADYSLFNLLRLSNCLCS